MTTKSSPSAPPRGRDLPGTWCGISAIITVPVALLAAAAITGLMITVRPADAQDRIELIKAGLGAGTGGVVALVLTGRGRDLKMDTSSPDSEDTNDQKEGIR